MTKPWVSWSRIDRNHPRIRPRGSKWRRSQRGGERQPQRRSGGGVGDRIRSGSPRGYPAPSLSSSERTGGGGSSKPRLERSEPNRKSNRARNNSAHRIPAPIPTSAAQSVCESRRVVVAGGGFEGGERRIFPNRGIPCRRLFFFCFRCFRKSACVYYLHGNYTHTNRITGGREKES